MRGTYRGSNKTAACGTKVKYGDRKQAEIAMRQKTANNRRGKFAIYVCAYCGGIHIGHKKGKGLSHADRVIRAINRAMAREDRV